MSLAVMSMMNGGVTLPLSLGVLVVLLILLMQRARYLYAFRHIPSPLALPFIGNAIQLNCSPEEFFARIQKWSLEFRDIYLVWLGMRPAIFLYRVELVRLLLGSSFHTAKSAEYEYLEPWMGTGLITSSGEKWHSRRKMLTPSFHTGVLEMYLKSPIREASVLVSRLRSEIGKPGFDVVPYIKLAAFDVICDSVMGYHIDAQKNCQDEYILAIDKITSTIQKRGMSIWMRPDIIFYCTSLGRAHQRALKVIHNFNRKIIADRKTDWKSEHDENSSELPRKRQAFLDLLLEMSRDGSVLSDDDICEEVTTFMFAGYDTVAATISWLLYSLGRNPEYQNKILEEYDTVVGSADITLEILNKLEWLDACIKESMRLYPAVPLIGRKIKTSLNIMGNDIPAGSTLVVNMCRLHRDPRYFPNPEVYSPERFLPGSPKPPPFATVPFSAGSRICIGRRFAVNEMKIMILYILRAFEIHSIDAEDQLRLTAELILNNTDGIRLTVKPRKRDTTDSTEPCGF